MKRRPVLELRKAGLYCPAGRFYVDPWGKVDRAIITHGHSDHSRWGMKNYLCHTASVPILRSRLGPEISVSGVDYGERLCIEGAWVSLHPAGHIPGSAQVRIEADGEVWVVSGDYKTEADRTCTPWEPVRCHGFVTETTFGLPIYRWTPQTVVAEQINSWWADNRDSGRVSVLFTYALGKAQRLMRMGDASIGPIVVHGAVATMNRACEAGGLSLPKWGLVSEYSKAELSGCLVLAPPSAAGSPWMRRFGDVSDAFASGWMAVRGRRRQRSVDRGFVLSDHVDWPSLLRAVEATGAETVWTTHGYAEQVARYLTERGLNARALETQFGEEEESVVTEDA